MLEVDEDSRLGREMLLGGVRYGASDTPGEDASAAFYEIAVERLAGIFEISGRNSGTEADAVPACRP